jgi:hypothetical protein
VEPRPARLGGCVACVEGGLVVEVEEALHGQRAVAGDDHAAAWARDTAHLFQGAERGIRHEHQASLKMVETPGMGSLRLGPLPDSSAQSCLRRYQAVPPHIRINRSQPRGKRFGGHGVSTVSGAISVSA